VDCGRTFRIQNGKCVRRKKAAEKWLLDRSTLRRIKTRTGTKSHSIHWEQAQKYATHIPSPLEHFKRNSHLVSGILILDGKHVPILGEDHCIHIAYDTGIGVVDYWIDCTENKTAYGYMVAQLKAAGYPFICVVSDGHFGIVPLIESENFSHQRCIFHLLQSLKQFLSQNGELTGGNKVLYARLKYILKTKSIEDLEKRVSWFRKFSAPNFTTKKQKSALRWLWEILPEATIHLCFLSEEVPRTTNLLENLNGQIEARLKTFRGVKSEQSLNNLLKILFRFRNYK
jgi:transposase-like protein